MKTRTAAAPLLLALVAAALVAPTGSSASSACKSGTTKVGGKTARTFCGTAKAHATVGSKAFSFSGGECTKTGTYFTINIGTIVINPVANAKPASVPYFGMAVTPASSGVHLGQTLSWVSGGKRYGVMASTIKLKAGFKSGTFSGTALPGGAKVKGTFTC
jgi:hypothetical protein